jgi:hypothetical protein
MAAIPPVPVHADFWTDVRLHVLQLLTELGVSLPAAEQIDAHRVCVSYFHVAHKRLEPRRRAVHWSRELASKTLSEDVLVGVRLIEMRSIAGDSLEPHFSERATRAHTHDWLLNDWGIHHLHVHAHRGDDLLYALAEPDDLYLLDVRTHNAMADVDLLETVLANWAQLLRPLLGLKGPPDGKNPTAEELQEARRSGVQPLLTLSDGLVYGPRGGGLTTARGSSAHAVSEADHVLRKARDIEDNCRRLSEGMARDLDLSELHLRYDPAAGTVTELQTGHVWPAR